MRPFSLPTSCGRHFFKSGKNSSPTIHLAQPADRILVMDHGCIIEEGTHAGLLAQGGHYAELYNTYFRHQSLEYVEGLQSLVTSDR
jgi:ABC-type multidrug transport system ATPase subunit